MRRWKSLARLTWPVLTTEIFSMAGEARAKMRSMAMLPIEILRTVKVLLPASPRREITTPSNGVAWTLPAFGSRVVTLIMSPTLKAALFCVFSMLEIVSHLPLIVQPKYSSSRARSPFV